MTPAARICAAIEILSEMDAARRPIVNVLTDWGRQNRYAGSKDRAAISSYVYDALRRRSSSAYIMGEDSARAVMIGALWRTYGLSAEALQNLFSGEKYAPAALSDEERKRLASIDLNDAPVHIAGDYPEWLHPYFERAFGARAVEEARALSARAPVDLRVNTLKISREKALVELAHLSPTDTPLSPIGLRIAISADGRGPALSAEPAYAKGQVEIQDEGSQLAALLAEAKPGEQALDLCAGGGGKTLALAAAMDNRGQIFATDADGRRLMPIFPRLERAGARNVQVRAPRGQTDVLADLQGRCDCVLVDAPCTGIGAWRRNPDAKWRMRPGALEQRIKDQTQALETAARCVKPGGRLVYITCSVLVEENEDRIADFCARHPAFAAQDMTAIVTRIGLPALGKAQSPLGPGLRLTPATTGTDGFYVCVLQRNA